ncbi:MAG TPA: hypothetical protein VLD59_14725, partial [Steroidobacteraceae bacterium]|nr:hypothetical protein [Steroidobacteraceae bacterium]
TFTPKPGLTRNQVRIATFAWPGFNVPKVRLLEVKAINEIDGAGLSGLRVWLDHMTCQGAGQFTSIHGAGWTPGGWTQQFWTNVEVADDKWSVSGFADLIRDVNCNRVQHGMILPKLTVNVTYGQMAPEPLEHNDIIAWNQRVGETIDNGIVYGYRGLSLDSGGVFFKNTGALNNTALVNIMANLTSANGSIFGENCGSLNHLLLYNLTHNGWWAWSLPQASMTNVSVRGCVWGAMGINAGFGDSVDVGWFDQNHYLNISGNNITPGTNVTTGNPQWDPNNFHPLPMSLLRRIAVPLVPIDAINVLRPTDNWSAVGAFE